MIQLLICTQLQIHKLAYGSDRAMAEVELATLIPLMGRHRYGRNGDEEKPTHTIKCPTGDVTIVLEKVETARIVDTDVDASLHEALNEKHNDRAIDREIQWRVRLADAGFLERKHANGEMTEGPLKSNE